MTMMTLFGRARVAAREDWAGNARLRWGTLAIVVILWAYGLLVGSEHLAARQEQLAESQGAMARLASLSRQTVWPARQEEARRQLQALERMLWVSRTQGAAEAAALDLLKERAARARLVVRELQIVGSPTGLAPTGASGGTAGRDAAGLPSGVKALRANVVVDYDRLPLLALLAELARNEQVVVVERLVLRTVGSTPRAELGLRVLYRERTGENRP